MLRSFVLTAEIPRKYFSRDIFARTSAISRASWARGIWRTTRHTDKRSALHRSRTPADRASAWQAERGSCSTRRHPREETAFVEFKLNCAEHPRVGWPLDGGLTCAVFSLIASDICAGSVSVTTTAAAAMLSCCCLLNLACSEKVPAASSWHVVRSLKS